MSEDGTPSPDPAPAPTPGSTRRVAIVVGVIALAIVGSILAITRHGHRATIATPGHGDGGAAAIHAPEAPRLPIPNGVRLTGFVVDGANLPVAGASVSAELEQGAADLVHARDAGIADAGVPTIATPTAADGHFVIDGLVAGRYRLRVTGAGLLAAEVRFVPVPSDEARIVVARQISIDGSVTDGGKPVATAHVGIRGDAIGGALELPTDATGAFHVPNLPEGRYQVYAWQAALAARAVRVNRLGAGPFQPVELRLEAGAIVVGRVIDRVEGTGLVAAIELRPTGDDQAPRYARSGDDGVFRIEGIPNGRWIADAFAPGYLSPGGVELDAGKGVPELALQRGAAIEGRVLDGDGNPIAGATVRALTAGTNPTESSAEVDADRLRRFSGRTAAPAAEPGVLANDPQLIPRGELGVMVGPIPPLPPPGAQVARAASVIDPKLAMTTLGGEPAPLPVDPAHASIWTTGSDGRYRIRGLARSKVTVVAAAPGFAEARSHEVTIGASETITGIDVVITAGTYLVGKITDQHGAPVIGAEVSARPDVGAPIEGFSDGDGTYKIGPIAGTIELRATAYGHGAAHRSIELPSPKGTVAAEHHEDLVLEVADAILAGTLDDTAGAPIIGAHLEVIDGAGEGRHAVVGADGTFSIDMLPRGHVRVRIDHPDYPIDELDAVASATGERARLHLAIGGAVEGALLDGGSGSPLAGLTIAATGPSGATAEATTEKTGRWKLGPLKPGHWKVEVKQPGYLPQARELDVPASHAPGVTSVRDVRIDLARGAFVGGTVRDARGQRVSGAHVVIASSGVEAAGDTDAQGEFRIHDAPTGDISVTATRGDAAGSTHATVRPGDEVLGLSIDIR